MRHFRKNPREKLTVVWSAAGAENPQDFILDLFRDAASEYNNRRIAATLIGR